MRPGVEVRPVEPGDVEGVLTLVQTARAESSVGSQVCSGERDALRRQLGTLTAVPGGTVLVAVCEGDVVGLLLGRVTQPNLFTDSASLAVDVVYVVASHRRRGVGRALMLGATEVALAASAEHVYVAPLPGARGMQRFVVQLGFAPAAAHRVATAAALHRRLTHDAPVARRSPRRIEDLIARRRESRRREGGSTEPEASPKHGHATAVLGDVVEPAAQPPRRAISRQVSRAVQTRFDLESSTTTS
ncbi:GNAT family N-acetyltransferase [Actinotalea sp. Marseille-Q4924]|uniref:GNAT family N-acetyltransferase n=1 Tax=Actinotalea sp. Marseille-Q4924 TaxID=2866571 RepID=UPI001CE3C8B1|nr:GNAT family N-acetyltransferase [Actinotalea sp. Marseille-Q4924]